MLASMFIHYASESIKLERCPWQRIPSAFLMSDPFNQFDPLFLLGPGAAGTPGAAGGIGAGAGASAGAGAGLDC